MTKTEVMALLKENGNDRGLEHWKKMGEETGGLKSFGIGLTQLRKLAKKIGRDHKLALQLWQTNNHDAKIVGLLIDEPKHLTRKQVEEQVEGVDAGMLSHVFSSCDATLPKADFALEVAKDWIESKDEVRRRCGWGLLYELSKNKGNKELTDEFFLKCIGTIGADIGSEENWVRLSMGGALMGIGKRNKDLNKAALKVAKAVGPIDYESGGAGCEPLDVVKHLASPALRKKLGI
jgi:3-methyladenine DNA glycosylase AlkD